MKRHSTDVISLVVGLFFVMESIGFVVNEITDRTFDPAWVSAACLTTLGAVALACTLLRPPRERDEGPSAADETTAIDEWRSTPS